MVDDEGFKDVINAMCRPQDGAYELPTATTLRREASSVAVSVHSAIAAALTGGHRSRSVFCTMDGYTGVGLHGFFNIEAHTLAGNDAGWQLMHHHLGMAQVRAPKTARLIAEAASGLVGTFEITAAPILKPVHVTMYTTDGAPNIVKAIRDHLRTPHFVCAAHQLQRCLAALEKVEAFSTLANKCRSIANTFHRCRDTKRCACWCSSANLWRACSCQLRCLFRSDCLIKLLQRWALRRARSFNRLRRSTSCDCGPVGNSHAGFVALRVFFSWSSMARCMQSIVNAWPVLYRVKRDADGLVFPPHIWLTNVQILTIRNIMPVLNTILDVTDEIQGERYGSCRAGLLCSAHCTTLWLWLWLT